MTWNAVAYKDFQDAARSRWLWGLSIFFIVFIGGTTALFFTYLTGKGAAAKDLFGLFAQGWLSFSYSGFLGFALAFIALVTSYGSVIDERESGTLKLLLSLPHSRRDVVVGKLAGRSAVVVVPVLTGFVVALVALVATGTSISFGALLPQIALTALLAMAFVSLGIGISAWADTNRQATVGALGLYFLFAILWSLFVKGFPRLVYEATKRLPGVDKLSATNLVKMRLFIKYLDPLRAYETLVAQLYSGNAAAARLVKAGIQERFVLQQSFQHGVPFYFTGWFILLVLLAWIVVPPILGYRVFRDADL
ncbi:MAG: ABC transporter permease [Salinigranum sp.]